MKKKNDYEERYREAFDRNMNEALNAVGQGIYPDSKPYKAQYSLATRLSRWTKIMLFRHWHSMYERLFIEKIK